MKTSRALLWIALSSLGTSSASGGVLPTLYQNNFESGLGGIVIDNNAGLGTGLWHLSTVCNAALANHSTPTALYYGRNDTCTYDIFAANQGTATTPVIAIQDLGHLLFGYFLETEGAPPFDHATVEISVNGGAFQTVASQDSGVLLADPSGTWQNAFVDISALLPPEPATLRVRFQFSTLDDQSNGLPGFYVDDVVVAPEPRFALQLGAALLLLAGLSRMRQRSPS